MGINTLLVEDESHWLNNYLRILKEANDITIIGFANTKEEAIKMARNTSPDIVLMDLNLSGTCFDGIQAIKEILKLINTKIIVVTGFLDEELVEEAFSVGALEYILKERIYRLPEVIREVHNQRNPHAILASAFIRLQKKRKFDKLSEAEKEILKMIKDGAKQVEVIEKLNKSERTIKNQVNSLLKKLKTSSCKEAVKIYDDFL